MATSGTYALTKSVENVIVEAYERLGVDAQQLNGEHLLRAMRSIQFMFSDWDNKGVKQWALDLQNFTTSQGVSEYTLATGTLDVLDLYLRRAGNDTPIVSMTRTEYAALNNKSDQGRPDRALIRRERDSVKMVLYYVPENSTDVIYYWRIRSLQDVVTAGEDPDAPRRWWDAIASGLAERLHMKLPVTERTENWVNLLSVYRADAKDKFTTAQLEDRERADFGMYPEGWT